MTTRQIVWARADLDTDEAWQLSIGDDDLDVAPILATVVRAADGWAWELRLTLGLGFQAGSCETRAQAMTAARDAVRSRLIAVSLLVMGAIQPAPEAAS